jgi:hypothetical protein
MHRSEGTHAFSETQLAPRLTGDLLIDAAKALEIRGVGDENPWHDIELRSIADRILADGKGLKHPLIFSAT